MNTIIQDIIYNKLREENEKEQESHIKSGKLSAGQLGSPVQWQILNALKVQGKEIDDYTLGKFKRGQEVEQFAINMLHDELYATQVDCNYRDCVGKLDIELFGDKWGLDYLPVEVKSVTNMAFKWIKKEGEAKQGHKLQAGMYALAQNMPKFSVLYVASDDYRTFHAIYDTDTIKDEIDMVIDLFNEYWNTKTIPTYEPQEHSKSWQNMNQTRNHQYNSYPDWWRLSESQLKLKARELFDKS